MKRRRLMLMLVVALAAAVVALVAVRNRRPPDLPRDIEHAVFFGAEACLACHGPRGSHPQSPDHPPVRECLRCHRFAGD